MDLTEIIDDISDILVNIDKSEPPFKKFHAGVGPYGEPQLVRLIAKYLNNIPEYDNSVVTRRIPDLLIPKEWAIEFKIARPFGDNGNRAENWSVNLLHPYPGNESSIGDCLKLVNSGFSENLAAFVIGYEHSTPNISLDPLVNSFELIADQIMGIKLSKREERVRTGLIHPIHQTVRIFAWKINGLA